MEVRAAILSRRHRMADATTLSIRDLVDDPFVAVAPPMTDVCAFWAASAERDGEAPRYGTEAWTVPEVLAGVGYLDNVITSFPSLLRFFRVPGLVAVPFTDVSPAPVTLVTRADGDRAVVTDFAAAVREVSARLVDLVQGRSWPRRDGAGSRRVSMAPDVAWRACAAAAAGHRFDPTGVAPPDPTEDDVFDISPVQIVIVLAIALLIFGPRRLPEMGRNLGRGIRDFKGGLTGEADPAPPAAAASAAPVPRADEERPG